MEGSFGHRKVANRLYISTKTVSAAFTVCPLHTPSQSVLNQARAASRAVNTSAR